MLKINKTSTKKTEIKPFTTIEETQNIKTTKNENTNVFTEISKNYIVFNNVIYYQT